MTTKQFTLEQLVKLDKRNCAACGKILTEKSIAFTADLTPYCAINHKCNADHVNSAENVVARGALAPLMTVAEAKKLIMSQPMSNVVRRILDQASRPIAFRISDMEALRFLNDVGDGNISKGIRDAIYYMMERERENVKSYIEDPDKEIVNIKTDYAKAYEITKKEPARETVPATQDDEFDYMEV